MRIPKCWRNTQGAWRTSCPLLSWIWRTTNLRTSRIAKDERRRKRPQNLSNILFVGPRQQGENTCRSACMLGGTRAKGKYHHNFVWVFANFIRNFNHRFGDNADERVDNGVGDNTFNACNIKAQGDDMAMVAHQSKADDPRLYQGVKTCFYYGKMGYIARFCYKAMNKERLSVNNAKDKDKLHLQSNTKCIQGAFANGSWIWESQRTWLRIWRYSTPTR